MNLGNKKFEVRIISLKIKAWELGSTFSWMLLTFLDKNIVFSDDKASTFFAKINIFLSKSTWSLQSEFKRQTTQNRTDKNNASAILFLQKKEKRKTILYSLLRWREILLAKNTEFLVLLIFHTATGTLDWSILSLFNVLMVLIFIF